MTPEDIQNIDFADTPESSYSSNKIKVVGVGGGGNNAINHMFKLGVKNVSFIVANTDRQALSTSPVPNKVLLGPNTLRGRGAGNVPDKARMAAEESAAEIERLFDEETDMVFITAGMGGGTGTGASPVIARIAKEKGLLTIGIVTIPFIFEGKKKILKALDGAKEMSKYVDALLVINNERLSDIYKDYDFLNAFAKADDILSLAATSISEIVTCDGYINLDFNDVDNTLRDGGTAIISTGYGEGEDRVRKAIDDALNSPLLRNTDIFGSRKLLFNLYFSRNAEEQFKIDETDQIAEFVSNIDKDVDVIWGVAFDESLGNKVKFTILAAGFDITLDDGKEGEGATTISPSAQHHNAQRAAAHTKANEAANERKLQAEYGDKMDIWNKMQIEKRYIILSPEQLDNEKVLEVLEQKPALNREKRDIDSVKKMTDAAPAKMAQPDNSNSPSNSKTINFNDL